MRIIYASKVILYLILIIILIKLFYYKRKIPGFKYILLWADPEKIPFRDLGKGNSGFISRKCHYTNCIVASDESVLGDHTQFDVVIFHAPELFYSKLPGKRLPNQKYVFASIESSYYYPLSSDMFDRYFNWTWTYRLDSEVQWGYIAIRDSEGNVIGPKKDMNWLDWNAMQPVSDELKEQLKSKTKVAAWFVSNCKTASEREKFVFNLWNYLYMKYTVEIEIYGNCSTLQCSREKEDECNRMIGKNYYFYLSFENALSEDYVTEKLLIPLKHNTVPIVYGGANYSRFLPNGSYLNARELGVNALGDKMMELFRNPEQYAEYFRWKNYYSFHKTSDSPDTNEYCKMCALLNDKKMLTPSVYKNLRDWWDPPELMEADTTVPNKLTNKVKNNSVTDQSTYY